MGPNPQHSNFTSKEQERSTQLKEAMNSPAASLNQQQIAQAELRDLQKSKEPQLGKNQQIRRERDEFNQPGGTENNMFHNDEAFERYQMGGHQKQSPSTHPRMEEQAKSDYRSVKMNHKADGRAKVGAGERLHDV